MRDHHRYHGFRNPSDGARAVELAFALDDAAAPTRFTVFPRDGVGNTTAWITVDVDDVVDLAEHA